MDERNNSGSWNSGNLNSGNGNSGSWNSGNWNSGDLNSGNWNSGDRNSGDRNSGSGNSGDWNSGWFNTDEPNARFFGRDADIKLSEFVDSERCPSWSAFELIKWIETSAMSDEEKKAHPTHKTCGGYLKTFGYKEAWANFWKATNESNRQKFLNLPNFDADIFFEITGIDVRKPNLSGKEVSVTIDGVTYAAIVK